MGRKNKEDWLRMGLKVLAKDGLSGLTIDSMAGELELTKGSFYHHFADAADFESQLLAYWADQYLATSDSLPVDPQERLNLLDSIMEGTFSEITAPEVAIRLWAGQDVQARSYVERVDAFRRYIVYNIFVSLVDNDEKASLMTDMLFTITIGSMTAIPQISVSRVLELYQEFKRLYDLKVL